MSSYSKSRDVKLLKQLGGDNTTKFPGESAIQIASQNTSTVNCKFESSVEAEHHYK
jgi:hypothetical protein